MSQDVDPLDELETRPQESGSFVRHSEIMSSATTTAECLRCGARGQVKLIRENKTLTCKKCGTKMHATPNGWREGRAVEAPSRVSQVSYLTSPTVPPSYWSFQEILGRYPILKSRPLWLGISGVLLLVVAIVVVQRLFIPSDLPTDLFPRGVVAADAIVADDRGKFLQLVDSSTRDEAQKVFDSVRGKISKWDRVRVQQKQLFSSSNRAGLLVTFVQAETGASKSPASKIEQVLIWNLHGDAWLINGKQTLEFQPER